MIGSLIGGALKIGSSIFGGIKASKAMKKVKRNLEDQKRQNEAWYDRRYNEDATQRADAQRILSMTQEAINKRNKQAARAQAVAGASDESVAMEKAANAKAMADATSQIAVAGERQKEAIEQQYQARDAGLNDALNNMEINKAQNIASAVNGVADAGASIANAFDGVEIASKLINGGDQM